MKRLVLLCAGLLLSACASQPPQPEWRMEAHAALERFVAASLSGNARVEAAEFERARTHLASTGQLALVARAELTRCAVRLASLTIEPCAGFEPLRPDAAPAERAYADYLAGTLAASDAPLLPEPHRVIANGQTNAAVLEAMADPVSRLIAAGVLFQAGQASPDVIDLAIQTASQQGWRRPLLAWLGVQLRRAEQAGADQEAARLRRRIALVSGKP